jgi:putative ABC transport system permease protein
MTRAREFLHDLRLTLRGLFRSPWLLVSATFCLALGIGANATMLEFLDFLLFRPPAHVRDAETVQRVLYREAGTDFPQYTFAYPLYEEMGQGTDAFSAVAAYFPWNASLGAGPNAQRIRVELVTASFFPLLGVQPFRGRSFSPSEGDPERPGPVALVSSEFWLRAFGGAEILGKPLRIGQQSFTVIGILPRRFTGVDLDPIDVWLPIGAVRFLGASPGWSRQGGMFFLNVIGRLRPGPAYASH